MLPDLLAYGVRILPGLLLIGACFTLVRWARFTPVTLTLGIGGGMLAAAPVLLLSLPTPLPVRGGAVTLLIQGRAGSSSDVTHRPVL
ncbi:hypothetical protein [Streptosporangium sp. NPDC003464]